MNNGNTLIKNNINFNSGFNQSNPSNNKNSSMMSYRNKTKSRNRNRNRFFSSRFNSGRYNLSEYFENLNLFGCNDQNNRNNSHFNPLRALFSDHISGITKKIFESWIKESYMLSEENLTNFNRIKRNPFEKEEFRKFIFKFYISLPKSVLNHFKNNDRRNLDRFGFNFVSALNILPPFIPKGFGRKFNFFF